MIIVSLLRESRAVICLGQIPLRRIFDRYIFTELLSPFLISLSVLSFIFFTKEMLRLVEILVSKGIGAMAVLNIIGHLMPSFLVLTLPIACLIASISAFSRLSFEKELTAMYAAGHSLFRIALPVCLFSFLVCLLTLMLSVWGQPWTNISLKKLALNLVKDQLTLAVDSGVFNEPFPGLMIYIPKHHKQQNPQGVFIADQRDPTFPRIIVADRFRVLNDKNNTQLGMRLFQGTIHQTPEDPQHYRHVAFSTYDLKMSLSETMNASGQPRPTYTEIQEQLAQSQWTDTNALRRMIEYYKNLAFPIAAFCLGLLGIPVGILSKRSGQMGSFAIGLAIVVLYYLLNILGEFFVTTLVLHPFAGAWLPNVVILLITFALLMRAGR